MKSKGNPIPAASREIVARRDRQMCVRCGGNGADWHHRRSRRIRDEHTHCPCNGVLLCRTDHSWAHANPIAAMSEGIIVSVWLMPAVNPVRMYDGYWLLSCDGSGKPLSVASVSLSEGIPMLVVD